uniref:Uncharacterized protein n=1 Tax=Rhizophagus irregularis (strain DAOM 181602 / DAOM 197198 / MUCL 43194) TaxID=747089 RepID=U9TJI0_RHIID
MSYGDYRDFKRIWISKEAIERKQYPENKKISQEITKINSNLQNYDNQIQESGGSNK